MSLHRFVEDLETEKYQLELKVEELEARIRELEAENSDLRIVAQNILARP